MSFAWSDFLRLAGDLAGADVSDALAEAKWRTAASRAYYAAYHATLAYYERHLQSRYGPLRAQVSAIDGSTRPLGRHERLIKGLKDTGDAWAAEVGEALSSAKATRVDADYRPRRRVDARTALSAVEHVRGIIDDVSAHSP